ncbi:50S ribosomal protein L29 [bacterium]|nr:50S ribosomal protein L29 [bacterium]
MKLQEMREKTVEELKSAVVDFKKQLLDLRVQKATNKLENTALIRQTKHFISQIKTVIKEKEEK